MVRQSLRTVVSGRQTVGNGNGANNSIRRNMSSPMDQQLGPNGGGLDANNSNLKNNNNLMINPQQQQQQQQPPQTNQQQMMDAEMGPIRAGSSMRFNYDMPQNEDGFIDESGFVGMCNCKINRFFISILKC